MANDRLTGLDTSFLHLEDDAAHMHVAAVMTFDGQPPDYEEFMAAIESRLGLVPRYRQKLALVPFGQGRPRWVDDPHFNLGYHVRMTALPEPGGEQELKQLAGRVFSQRLDRDKPLWEIWLVDGVNRGNGFAILSKTHHALVDGISGIDIISVLFDTRPEPSPPPAEGRRWLPAPMPSRAQLLAEALLERATMPAEIIRGARALVRAPRRIAGALIGDLVGVGAMAWAGLNPAPDTPFNGIIGPHRRFTWVRMSLADAKAIKNSLGGTVNDVMLAIVARALGLHLRRRGIRAADDFELKAMVPVSLRSEEARGTLGNQVAAMMAPLPVGCEDPAACHERIQVSMEAIKHSGQAVGAHVLTELTGFAPPNLLSQGTRAAARQRFFNLVVTNVPGPQFPLYLMGREMQDIFPMVPLARSQGLGVAIMSYNGQINFGLVGDYDLMADIEDLAEDFHTGLEELAEVAGVELTTPRRRRRAVRSGNGHRPGRRVGSTSTIAAGTARDGES